MGTRDIDRGYRRLIEQLEGLGGGVRTTVGIHAAEGAEAHPSGGGSIVEVAALGEFGTVTQPPRSFVRAAFDENVTEIGRSMVAAACKAARDEAKIEDAFAVIGRDLRDKMIAKMDDAVPLDEDTVEAKAAEVPLLETGVIREALRVRVNDREVA